MKKITIALYLCVLVNVSGFAQGKSRHEMKGDRYAFLYDFDGAIDAYEKANHLTSNGQRSLASSYHKIGLNSNAEEAYAVLYKSKTVLSPEDYYNYALVLRMNGKYMRADSCMQLFQMAKPNDLRTESYVTNRMDFYALSSDNNKFKINEMFSNAHSDDIGPTYFQDKIVFASSRTKASILNRKYKWNNQPFLDLYVASIENNQLKNPENFDKQVNTNFHDGPASFNKNGTQMVFTRNNHRDRSKDKVVELQLFESKHVHGKWEKPQPMQFNNPSYSVGQPFLSADGNTLYFTSDMPGGYGGSDLYKSTRIDSTSWSKEQNLGNKINTEGDEMFPYLQEKNNILFFASDGRYGFGGLDIFMCLTQNDQFGKVSNVGYPLNSQSDDYALIVNDSLTNGYFSSNRNSSGMDHIYNVELLKSIENGKIIEGKAKDYTGKFIPNTFIVLQNEVTKVVDTVTADAQGFYTFFVESNKEYQLVGTKDQYLDGHTKTRTFGSKPIIYSDIVLLEKFIADSSLLVAGTDLTKFIKAHPSFQGNLKKQIAYFDFDRSTIRPDAALEFDKVVAIMNTFPHLIIQLGSHTDCSASKEYNQLLSDKRAKSSLEYIQSRITNPNRITGKGYGETRLINGCNCEGVDYSTCPDAKNQLNRRTEFIIINSKTK